MLTTRRRVEKLENVLGADAFQRWLRTATEDEIDARIHVIDQRLRSALAEEGVDCTGLTIEEALAIADEFEANGGHRPSRFENNQEIS